MMNIKSDIHTHTFYCDGEKAPVCTVMRAISLGLVSVGFSGHATMSIPCEWSMTSEKRDAYIDDINKLKEKYKDKIDILLGEEFDIFSNDDISSLDYAIGSVHYVEKDGHYFSVDKSAQTLSSDVSKYFGGDFISYCEKYFEELLFYTKRPDIRIIGHFDLVSKFNEGSRLFDENDVRYARAAENALEALVSANKIFEINTGAMTRNGNKTPYPSLFLLGKLYALGADICFSSDSHTPETLCAHFDTAVALAKSVGFTHAKRLTKTGFEDIEI